MSCRQQNILLWVAILLTTADSVGRAQRPSRAPDIYFAPTWEPVVYEMLELAGVTRDDVVYDLGSGYGRIVILAAQKYGARGIGVELDPKLVAISRDVARQAGLSDKVTFLEEDLFAADVSKATVVTLYLSESVNRELEPKLRRELRPGTTAPSADRAAAPSHYASTTNPIMAAAIAVCSTVSDTTTRMAARVPGRAHKYAAGI